MIFRSLFILFYSASALLAMQSAVLARGILSVCLSVCPSDSCFMRPSALYKSFSSSSSSPSVTFLYCVEKNEDTIVRFSVSGRTILLVSGEVKFIRIFTRNHPSGGVKVRHPSIDSENSTNNRP